MDSDFWASRFHSAKQLTAMQAARLNSENHLSLDDYEGDDDIRACFPCPFCYVEIEVPVLCAHLQEEHCFDVKNAVCPVCASNLGKDMIGHFTVQHAHLLKRRRKSQRSGVWTSSSSMLGKELRELSSFLGAASKNGRGSAIDSTPDPLLSPFLCSIVLPDTEDGQDTHSKNDLPTSSDMKSVELSTSDKVPEQDYRERSQRAEFFQRLILSTIF
ncbi:protein DEHYDRATION-INDUCED 19 homolog 5-like isoform X2 [Macadamia integrifolia]|uniref:protein DEHYDRATION-INDUCED 19 homolog 5-like isoform X2 n=1 Tax=Macadamia integrifolia TaxID=60698 RepID=UPI001C4EF5B2|nr:protein DEHYDRATION-INDUCED 19 homolog 5-like isoform X2 [Macadamia integrifolia]